MLPKSNKTEYMPMKKSCFPRYATLALLGALTLRAQDTAETVPLREYSNPPAIRPVDTVFMEDMTWLEIHNAIQAGKTTVIVPAGTKHSMRIAGR